MYGYFTNTTHFLDINYVLYLPLHKTTSVKDKNSAALKADACFRCYQYWYQTITGIGKSHYIFKW